MLLAQSPYQEATHAFQQGRWEEAAGKLRTIKPPRPFASQFLLGAALVQAGRSEEAIAELKLAHAANPAHADALKLLASEQLRAGHAAETIALLRGRPDRHPRDLEFHLLLLQAYQDRGEAPDIEAALALARRGLARFPKSAQIHAWLGYALRESGQFAEARKHLETSIRLDPADPFPQTELADVFVRQGDPAEGKRRLDAVLERFPDHLDARIGLARALAAMGQVKEAVTELERCAAQAPGRAQIHLELSRLWARLGNTAAAEREAAEFRRLRTRR